MEIRNELRYLLSVGLWERMAADGLLTREDSVQETRQVEELVKYDFPYVMMNDVMRVVKEMQPRIVSQEYDNTCSITLSIRKSEAETLRGRLKKLSFE